MEKVKAGQYGKHRGSETNRIGSAIQCVQTETSILVSSSGDRSLEASK